MSIIISTPDIPNIARGTVARSPQESLYPHLWEGAMLLMAPGLGDQGRNLIDWTIGRTKGLTRSSSTTSTATPGDGMIVQTTTAADRLWEADGASGRSHGNRHALVMGVPNNAATFVRVPHHNALNLTTAGTLMCWGRMIVSASGMMIGKGNENYYFQILTTGTIFFEWNNGGFENLQFTAAPFVLGQWYHYTVTWDNLRMRGYRNGRLLGAPQTMPTALAINTEDVTLYRSAAFGNPFRGAIDDVRIYNRPLSSAEIEQSYAVDLTPYRRRVIRYFFMTGARIMGEPSQARYQAQAPIAGMSEGMVAVTPARAQYQAQTIRITRGILHTPSRSQYQAQTPRITVGVVAQPSRAQYRAQTPQMNRLLQPTPGRSQYRAVAASVSVGLVILTPSRAQYQAQTPTAWLALQVIPARAQYQAQMGSMSGGGMTEVNPSPSRAQYQAQTPRITRGIVAQPSRAQYRAQVPMITDMSGMPSRAQYRASEAMVFVEIPTRDVGSIYRAAFANPFIAGDWLVQAPDIGLKLSFSYDPDGTWSHRMISISDIEVAVAPGGGIASVSNVTLRIAEDDTSESLLALWERSPNIQGSQITVDFLLDGETLSLRMFTGHIDSINFQDGISEILCVDNSIQRNLLLPQGLITREDFPNADSRALTQPKPIIYGSGSVIIAAPLLLVDVTTNTYLVAGHPLQLGGQLAVYDNPTTLYLTIDSVIPISVTNNLITLGTVDLGSTTLMRQLSVVSNASAIADGNSSTYAVIGTNALDSNLVDGIGWIGVNTGRGGYPNTQTIQIALTNHRRSPGSDPTTKGTFIVRTIDTRTMSAVQTLFTTSAFNHVTSAQNTFLTLSGVGIPLNEVLEVLLVVRNEGTVSNVSATYEIGEISIVPLIVYSATPTSAFAVVTLPVPTQELRFNYLTPPLFVETQRSVSFASNAIDGVSTTLALLGTGVVDSNLDGIGELILATSATPTQRANNTVVVNFLNHRRNLSSTPTVTGTFNVQTLNAVTSITLRENLFTTQSFRHTLNPQNTSFTAPSINLGANERLAIRLLSRNEGGVGSAGQNYEIGEVTLESFYQPNGDSIQLFLTGSGWSGRRDETGVLAYAGLPIGTLYSTPDQVIASVLRDELNLILDAVTFAAAYTFFGSMGFRIDGGIGIGWAVPRQNARDILGDLARQSTSILYPVYSGAWGLRPYALETTPVAEFDVSNILLANSGNPSSTVGESPQSTFTASLGDLETVYNRFEVRYQYNTGSQKFDKLYYADYLSTNSPDGSRVVNSCALSFNRYGKLEPLVIDAYWISDDTTAQLLLRHLVEYFSDQRIQVRFETTIAYIALQVGEFIRITYPLLPTNDNGGIFEIHRLRYLPISGRIVVTASKRISAVTALVRATVLAKYSLNTDPLPMSIPFIAPGTGTTIFGGPPAITYPVAAARASVPRAYVQKPPSQAKYQALIPTVDIGELMPKAKYKANQATISNSGGVLDDWYLTENAFASTDPPYSTTWDFVQNPNNTEILYAGIGTPTDDSTWDIGSPDGLVIGRDIDFPTSWAEDFTVDSSSAPAVTGQFAATRFGVYGGIIYIGGHGGAAAAGGTGTRIFQNNGGTYSTFQTLTGYDACTAIGTFSVTNKIYFGFKGDPDIYSWDGSSWGVVRSFSGSAVTAICEFNSKLYVTVEDPPGGGSGSAPQIWSYNGMTWTLEEQIGGFYYISDLCVYMGMLYTTVYSISEFGTRAVYRSTDGSTWTEAQVISPASGPSSARTLTSLATDGVFLYVGLGSRDITGGTLDAKIWAYDGSTWALAKDFNSAFSDTLRPSVTAIFYDSINDVMYCGVGDNILFEGAYGTLIYNSRVDYGA